MDNVNGLDQTQTTKKNFLVPFLIVLILVAVFEFVLLIKKDRKVTDAVSTNEQVTQQVKGEKEGSMEGSLKLTTDSKTNYVVGVPFTVNVNANSNGRGVVAFDAVLQYDNSAFTLSSVSSTVTNFSATSSSSKGYLDITSSKNPQSTVTPVFKDTSVLTITLVPKKTGNFAINLLDKVGNSSTKFIDNNTRIFLPSISSVNVMVK